MYFILKVTGDDVGRLSVNRINYSPHVDYSKHALDALVVMLTDVLEGVYDFAEFNLLVPELFF